MNPSSQTCNLCVLNRSEFPARLRFYGEQHLLWDIWLAPGGGISVPDPRQSGIDACAVFTDPLSNVTYTVPACTAGHAVKLVASMRVMAGALRFGLDTEPGGRADEIALHNRTSGTVRFDVRLRHSPFGLTQVLASGSGSRLELNAIDVAATVNGMTTASVRIGSWSSDVLIDTEAVNGNELPKINVLTRGHRH